MKKWIASSAALLGAFAPAAMATSPYVEAQEAGKLPNRAGAGEWFNHIWGLADSGCTKGNRVILYTWAFRGSQQATHTYQGIPAVYSKISNHHQFRTGYVLIAADRGPQATSPYRTYKLRAACNSVTFATTTIRIYPPGY